MVDAAVHGPIGRWIDIIQNKNGTLTLRVSDPETRAVIASKTFYPSRDARERLHDWLDEVHKRLRRIAAKSEPALF